MPRCLSHLTSPELADAAGRPGSTVVWPWGACEQHGPHLPLATDALFADQLLDQVLDRLPSDRPIWRMPLQPFGCSPEHQGFAGTITLPATLLIDQVVAVGRQLAAAGFQRLVLFNAHGGQIGLLQVAARELRAEVPSLAVLPCFVWSGPTGIAELIPEPERSGGLHAGLAETSLMLHLRPDLVGPLPPADGHRGGTPPAGWSLEGAVPTAWMTRELSASGVIGDPRQATAALGSQLAAALVNGWCALLDALLTSDWPQSG